MMKGGILEHADYRIWQGKKAQLAASRWIDDETMLDSINYAIKNNIKEITDNINNAQKFKKRVKIKRLEKTLGEGWAKIGDRIVSIDDMRNIDIFIEPYVNKLGNNSWYVKTAYPAPDILFPP
jgi:hypothetical protein